MGLESTPSRISDLDDTWPLSTDIRHQGDNQMRNIKAVLNDVLQRMIGTEAESELTIVAGSITPIAGVTSVRGQATADDDLDTIVVTNFLDNSFIYIHCGNASEAITVTNNDNIITPDASDIVLDDVDQYLLLRRNGANWEVLEQVIAQPRLIEPKLDDVFFQENASGPDTAPSGHIAIGAVESGDTTGLHAKDDAGKTLQAGVPAYAQITDNTKSFGVLESGMYHCIPTAAAAYTMPGTGARAGWEITLVNITTQGTPYVITIKDSLTVALGVLHPGAVVTLRAIVNDPASAADWLIVDGLPAGIIMDYAASIYNDPDDDSLEPIGWLWCDGQAVSRTTYARLFAAIRDVFGVGDGSTTFNLPDTRGRVIAGLDNMGGSAAGRMTEDAADTIGGASGDEDAVVVIHKHALRATSSAANITEPDGSVLAKPSSIEIYDTSPVVNATMESTSLDNTGVSGTQKNLPPYLALGKIIKW